jgi:hypothetical protein
MEFLQGYWNCRDIGEIYVTCRTAIAPQMLGLLRPFGFEMSHVVRHRYGRDQHEAVLRRLERRLGAMPSQISENGLGVTWQR